MSEVAKENNTVRTLPHGEANSRGNAQERSESGDVNQVADSSTEGLKSSGFGNITMSDYQTTFGAMSQASEHLPNATIDSRFFDFSPQGKVNSMGGAESSGEHKRLSSGGLALGGKAEANKANSVDSIGQDKIDRLKKSGFSVIQGRTDGPNKVESSGSGVASKLKEGGVADIQGRLQEMKEGESGGAASRVLRSLGKAADAMLDAFNGEEKDTERGPVNKSEADGIRNQMDKAESDLLGEVKANLKNKDELLNKIDEKENRVNRLDGNEQSDRVNDILGRQRLNPRDNYNGQMFKKPNNIFQGPNARELPLNPRNATPNIVRESVPDIIKLPNPTPRRFD